MLEGTTRSTKNEEVGLSYINSSKDVLKTTKDRKVLIVFSKNLKKYKDQFFEY